MMVKWPKLVTSKYNDKVLCWTETIYLLLFFEIQENDIPGSARVCSVIGLAGVYVIFIHVYGNYTTAHLLMIIFRTRSPAILLLIK